MRLTAESLFEITGYKIKTAQARWFLSHLGVQVPVDRNGVIMTVTAYEMLIEKRLGLLPRSISLNAANDQQQRPSLRSQRI